MDGNADPGRADDWHIAGLVLTLESPPKSESAPGIYETGKEWLGGCAAIPALPHRLEFGVVVEVRVPPRSYGDARISILRSDSERVIPSGIFPVTSETLVVTEPGDDFEASRFVKCPLDVELLVIEEGSLCLWAAIDSEVDPSHFRPIRVVCQREGLSGTFAEADA